MKSDFVFMIHKDVPCTDAEGVSDIFIKAWIDDKDKKETDCHYRCKDGKASFNYRLALFYKSSEKEQQYHFTSLGQRSVQV